MKRWCLFRLVEVVGKPDDGAAVTLLRRFLYGVLYLSAWFYDGIEISKVFAWTSIHLYGAVLVGSFSRQTGWHPVLWVVLGCPALIFSEQATRIVRIPCVTIASLTSYLVQAATWHTVTVADEGFAPFFV